MLTTKRIHKSIFNHLPNNEYQIGKYKYRFDLVDQSMVDETLYYTFNVFKKRFLFWRIIEVFEDKDYYVCIKECDDYLNKIEKDDRQ